VAQVVSATKVLRHMCVPELHIKLVNGYEAIILLVHILGEIINLKLIQQFKLVQRDLEATQCHLFEVLRVLVLAYLEGSYLCLRLNQLKGALGILFIKDATSELAVNQVHEIQQVYLIRVVTVLEVVPYSSNILNSHLYVHVFLKSVG